MLGLYFLFKSHNVVGSQPQTLVPERVWEGVIFQEHYWLAELLEVPTEPSVQACLSPIAWGQHKLLLSPALSSAAKPPGAAVRKITAD